MTNDELADRLRGLGPPFFHVLPLDENGVDVFVGRLHRPMDFALRIVHGECCTDIESLYDEWTRSLGFPGYFGRNWDAFDECLGDELEAVSPGCTVLVRNADQILASDKSEHKLFLSVLNDAADYCATGRGGRVGEPPPRKPVHFILHCYVERERFVSQRLEDAWISYDRFAVGEQS